MTLSPDHDGVTRAARGDSPATRRPRRGRILRTSGLTLAAIATAIGLNVGFGSGGAAAQEDDRDLIARGAEIYGARCATCHGDLGRGVSPETNPSNFGPPLQGLGPAAFDFMIRTGRMPLDDPRDPVRHGPQILTDQQRRAVVAWSRTLPGGGPEIPDIGDWQDASLSRGLELFTTNCAACHGPTAAGIAVGQEDVSSNLAQATPLEIAEAVRVGPGVMPLFSEDALDHEDLEAVTRWVVHLRERAAPGGLSVGRSGPVSEGAVAWVVGMGLLGVVMYLLGERSHDEEFPADQEDSDGG